MNIGEKQGLTVNLTEKRQYFCLYLGYFFVLVPIYDVRQQCIVKLHRLSSIRSVTTPIHLTGVVTTA